MQSYEKLYVLYTSLLHRSGGRGLEAKEGGESQSSFIFNKPKPHIFSYYSEFQNTTILF